MESRRVNKRASAISFQPLTSSTTGQQGEGSRVEEEEAEAGLGMEEVRLGLEEVRLGLEEAG